MPVLPYLRRSCLSAVFFVLLLFAGCGSPGSSRSAVSIQFATGIRDLISPERINLAVIDKDPNILWCEIKMFPQYSGMNGLVEKFLAVVDSVAVASQVLDTQGRAELEPMPPGQYWVITAGMATSGNERLLWSLPLTVDSLDTGPRELVMHRSNAALVLGPGNTGL